MRRAVTEATNKEARQFQTVCVVKKTKHWDGEWMGGYRGGCFRQASNGRSC